MGIEEVWEQQMQVFVAGAKAFRHEVSPVTWLSPSNDMIRFKTDKLSGQVSWKGVVRDV